MARNTEKVMEAVVIQVRLGLRQRFRHIIREITLKSDSEMKPHAQMDILRVDGHFKKRPDVQVAKGKLITHFGMDGKGQVSGVFVFKEDAGRDDEGEFFTWPVTTHQADCIMSVLIEYPLIAEPEPESGFPDIAQVVKMQAEAKLFLFGEIDWRDGYAKFIAMVIMFMMCRVLVVGGIRSMLLG